MAKKEYQRLTRARSKMAVAVMSRSSLWLADDHLLLVDSSGYAEKYKRFYFRDIQSIVLQRTARNFNWNIGFGVAAVLFLVLILSTMPKGSPSNWSGATIAGGIFLGLILAVLIVLLLVNVIRGATCKCFLRTAVQVEELPSLTRLRQAQKVFARLRPFIASAQGGELTAEMISAQMQEPVPPPATVAPASETTSETAPGIASAAEPNLPPKLDS